MIPFFVSHDGVPLEIPKIPPQSPEVEQQTLDEFYEFCPEEAGDPLRHRKNILKSFNR